MQIVCGKEGSVVSGFIGCSYSRWGDEFAPIRRFLPLWPTVYRQARVAILKGAEREDGIQATEGEGVREGEFRRCFARGVDDGVDIEGRIDLSDSSIDG
jgi:hypothetical protein